MLRKVKYVDFLPLWLMLLRKLEGGDKMKKNISYYRQCAMAACRTKQVRSQGTLRKAPCSSCSRKPPMRKRFKCITSLLIDCFRQQTASGKSQKQHYTLFSDCIYVDIVRCFSLLIIWHQQLHICEAKKVSYIRNMKTAVLISHSFGLGSFGVKLAHTPSLLARWNISSARRAVGNTRLV